MALKMRELGKMSPEERQVEGPRINGLREAVATREPRLRHSIRSVIAAPWEWGRAESTVSPF